MSLRTKDNFLADYFVFKSYSFSTLNYSKEHNENPVLCPIVASEQHQNMIYISYNVTIFLSNFCENMSMCLIDWLEFFKSHVILKNENK